MPGLYKDEAVVLRTMKLGEADRILTLFARGSGKVRAVVKGIRKPKSRWGGRLEPYNRVALMLYRGRDLDTVTSADIVDPYKEVRADYARLTAAAALAEVVDKITPDRERAFPTYALLVSGLHALDEGRGPTVVPAFLIKLLSLSGYHPQLTVCSGCGNGAGPHGFSPALGGVVCEACWEQDPHAYRLGPDRVTLMAKLLASDFGQAADSDALAEVTEALRRYAEYHLERPLRSLSLPAI